MKGSTEMTGLGSTGMPIEEESILGVLLTGSGPYLASCQDWGVRADWFRDARAQEIYAGIEEMFAAGEPIDTATVSIHLLNKGNKLAPSWCEKLSSLPVLASHLEFYVRELRKKGFVRKAIEIGQELKDELSGPIGDVKSVYEKGMAKMLSLLEEQTQGEEASPYEMRAAGLKEWKELAEKGRGTMSGISWGIEQLDVLTQGIQKKGLWIVAARPSVGKTMFEGFLRREFLRRGLRCMFCSLDMGSDVATQRDVCAIAGESMGKLRAGMMTASDAGKLEAAVEVTKAWEGREFVFSKMDTVEAIVMRARAIKQTHGLDVLTVDYAQLVGVAKAEKWENMNLIIGKVTKTLKNFSNETGTPVILLSQLSRSVEQEKRDPQLSDLRDSGSIEQDAKGVIFLYAEKTVSRVWMERQGKADWKALEIRPVVANVLKYQDGQTGVVGLRQLPKYFTFEEAAPLVNGALNPGDDAESVAQGYDFTRTRRNPYVVVKHPKGAYEVFAKKWLEPMNEACDRLGNDRYEVVCESNGFEEGVQDLMSARAKKLKPKAVREEEDLPVPVQEDLM